MALTAAGGAKDVCGLVLVAAPGRPLGEALRQQLRSNTANAPFLDQALSAIDSLEAGQPVDITGMHPALMQLFAPPLQKFMISLLSYDPGKMLSQYEKPVLILPGQRDIQVSEEDAQRLEKANGRAKLVIIPGANHVLKSVGSNDRSANIATYSNPALPLAAGVVEAIAGFVQARRPVSLRP